MGARYLAFLFVALVAVAGLGCDKDSERDEPERPYLQDETPIYTFQSDDTRFLRDATPHVFPAGALVEDVLDSLGSHLANTYFFDTFRGDTTQISFDIVSVKEMGSPERRRRTAVIDMIDPERFAMGYFFQGSTGGKVTFCMLAATFLQPRGNSSLLDELTILYNGAEMEEELDHINLHGVLVPRMVVYEAVRAIEESPSADSD